MTQLYTENIQSDTEARATRRARKKRTTMKVSGRSVRELQRLIIKRGRQLDRGV